MANNASSARGLIAAAVFIALTAAIVAYFFVLAPAPEPEAPAPPPAVQSPTAPGGYLGIYSGPSARQRQSPTGAQSPQRPGGAQSPAGPNLSQSPAGPAGRIGWVATRDVTAPGVAPAGAINAELVDELQPGATYEMLAGRIGAPGQVIAREAGQVSVVRWDASDGNGLIARFENGQLVRKSVVDAEGRMLDAPPPDAGGMLAPENYNALALGMSFQAVRDLIRVPYRRVAGAGAMCRSIAGKTPAGRPLPHALKTTP
mgnify:FL=1